MNKEDQEWQEVEKMLEKNITRIKNQIRSFKVSKVKLEPR